MKSRHPPRLRRSPRCTAPAATRSRPAPRRPTLHVELCSECHPFYTGKQKLVDTGGRIDRFERRYGSAASAEAAADPLRERLTASDLPGRPCSWPIDARAGPAARRQADRARPPAPGRPRGDPRTDFPGGAALVGRGPRRGCSSTRAPGAARSAPALVVGRPAGRHRGPPRRRPTTPGVLARRAALFDPAPTVWSVDGTDLAAGRPRSRRPSPRRRPPGRRAGRAAGRRRPRGPRRGRARRGRGPRPRGGPHRPRHEHVGIPLDEPLLEVGVGQADRELTGDAPRRPGPDRPAGPGRRDRPRPPPARAPSATRSTSSCPSAGCASLLVADPAASALAALRPVPAAVPRANLRDRGVAVAVGRRPRRRAPWWWPAPSASTSTSCRRRPTTRLQRRPRRRAAARRARRATPTRSPVALAARLVRPARGRRPSTATGARSSRPRSHVGLPDAGTAGGPRAGVRRRRSAPGRPRR